MEFSRREFLKTAGIGSVAIIADKALALETLQPAVDINPLESYPDKDWEKIYRDQYRYDSTFTYVCSPNDTHACRVKAFVRNGVIMRLEQNYDIERYSDLYGNKATACWNPRMCLKGYTFHRKVYGPYRLKSPLIKLECYSCHTFPGGKTPSDVGTDLTYIGGIHRPDYLLEFLKEPNASIVPNIQYYDEQKKGSTMPKYDPDILPEKGYYDMVEYMRTLK